MNILKMTLLLTFVFISLGCATNRYTYDKSVLEDGQCIIIIPKDIVVVKFNEDKVKWKVGYNIIHSIVDNFSRKEREAFVKIPEGKHTLTINYLNITSVPSGYNTYTYTSRSANGIKITEDFQHGHTYSLIPLIFGDKIAIMVRKH